MMSITAATPLPDVNAAAGSTAAAVNLDSYFKDANAAPNYAMVDTTLGTIPVLLTPKTTPITVANFLGYASKGDYTNTVVHRSVPGFIWQTGGYQLNGSTGLTPIAADAPIKNEFGASNVRGTIAMAKLGNDPNSATSQFFFNESDSNASNLDNQNGGFTVFGHVVGAQGLAVMDAVAGVPVPSPGPLGSPLDQIPLQNYTAGSSVQPANLILIKGVTTASEAFDVTSDTPNVAAAAVQGSTLVVAPLAPGTAHITVTGYGSDGNPATETFAVHVGASGAATTAPTTTTPPAGTATPPATTTPTGPPVAPVASAPPASALVPSARGAIPASAVSGRKAKIQETVSLLAPTVAVAQQERVKLSLSTTTTGAPGDYDIAAATARVKLKPGQHARLGVGTKQLAAVPAGSYHVLVSVTDPDGAATTVDTGKVLTVLAPGSKATAR